MDSSLKLRYLSAFSGVGHVNVRPRSFSRVSCVKVTTSFRRSVPALRNLLKRIIKNDFVSLEPTEADEIETMRRYCTMFMDAIHSEKQQVKARYNFKL